MHASATRDYRSMSEEVGDEAPPLHFHRIFRVWNVMEDLEVSIQVIVDGQHRRDIPAPVAVVRRGPDSDHALLCGRVRREREIRRE